MLTRPEIEGRDNNLREAGVFINTKSFKLILTSATCVFKSLIEVILNSPSLNNFFAGWLLLTKYVISLESIIFTSILSFFSLE